MIFLFLGFVSFYANFNIKVYEYLHLVFLLFYIYVQYPHCVLQCFIYLCNTFIIKGKNFIFEMKTFIQNIKFHIRFFVFDF